MTKEIEVLKIALEFAEDHLRHWSGVGRSGREVVAAIKEVLDKPEPWEKFCDSNCVWTDHHHDCKLAEQEPVAAQCKFESEDLWLPCSIEHHNLVQSEPMKWPQYQTRLLYTTPPQDKPDYWPLDEWSEWRDMVVVNLMRHGNIDKHFARRLAYFYQSKAPQCKPLTAMEVYDVVHDADLDWHTGFALGEDENRFVVFARAIEAAHGIKGEA